MRPRLDTDEILLRGSQGVDLVSCRGGRMGDEKACSYSVWMEVMMRSKK